ncbi:hypothetical protein KGF54_003317 [Candida jiufengensis]|uniref:uncharacterized protein n=1 Tax=Candida jiufengensis TaxID=497108 RepID=UPI00222510AC|nr:uncharacterized protein KGF54_003317 [Candida jiufengensis]KAI5952450.1 hypothetical protein KGF54_003317 [Candida jiufengensis]
MEREYSPITFNEIESESTPIRRSNELPDTEFITADGIVNTTIPIDDKNENTEEIEEVVNILENERELDDDKTQINPVNVAYLMFSPKRKQQQQKLEKLNPEPVRSQTQNNQPSTSTDNNYKQTILNNPMIPYTLNLYFQLIMNVILWSFIIYLTYISYKTIKSDIYNKIESKVTKILDEISYCAKQFQANNCGSSNRPPAIAQECDALERCQNQSIQIYGTSLTLSLLAEVLNSFVNQLSLKTILVCGFLFLGAVFMTGLNINNFNRDLPKITN